MQVAIADMSKADYLCIRKFRAKCCIAAPDKFCNRRNRHRNIVFHAFALQLLGRRNVFANIPKRLRLGLATGDNRVEHVAAFKRWLKRF